MENAIQFSNLTPDEVLSCNGGGFAYDVGCLVGFFVRSVTEGPATAYAMWFAQHPDK